MEEIEVIYQRAATCFQQGELAEAAGLAQQVLGVLPVHGDANQLLGLIAIRHGNPEQAIQLIAHAIEANPRQPMYHYNLGLALHAGGHLEEALAAYDESLRLQPNFIEAHINRGITLHDQGLFEDALAACEQVVRLAPEQPMPYYNLGNALNSLGRLEEALAAYEQVLRLQPDFVPAHTNRTCVLQSLGRLKAALTANEQVLRYSPAPAEAYNNQGNMLSELGRHAEALAAYERAIDCSPGYAEAHSNRGNALGCLGRSEEALQAYGDALRINPEFAAAYGNQGDALMELGRLEAALDATAKAVQLGPDLARMHCGRGNVLMASGDSGAAVDSYRRALELDPDYTDAHSNLLFALSAGAHMPAAELLEELRGWDRVHGREGRLHPLPARNREPFSGRRLRVGYVSSDLHQHPVSYFFEPLLAAHDTTRFEIFCYASHPSCHSDATTDRLRGLAEHWRFVIEESDESLARQIHEDGIDILIDLAGHTLGNRLKAFTYRPAPVQATYLGFFAGTGLEAMDYWITDGVLHPQETPEMAVEQLYRLPRCWVCYRPPEEVAEVLPCRHDDNHITFGCFSNISKFSPVAIETWSQLLHSLDESRLLLIGRAFGDARTRERLLGKFSQHGIPRERLILRGDMPHTEYMAAYSGVDIMLDPFPRTGGTTTAESLWMGVPVVTLAGQCYVERISASKLVAVGLEDLIASNREEYIDKALALANDHARRLQLRKTLRDRMQCSALCDAGGLARSIENAYETMWECYLQESS